jgi:hypothetical protein
MIQASDQKVIAAEKGGQGPEEGQGGGDRDALLQGFAHGGETRGAGFGSGGRCAEGENWSFQHPCGRKAGGTGAPCMRPTRKLLCFLLLLVSACAAAPQAARPAGAAAVPASAQGLERRWWDDNRWRYHDDAEAEAAYQRLLTRESPWPEWHQVQITMLPAGLRFEMALAPGQGTDRPGAFGTFERIESVRFVRYSLAVKNAWKPRIDRVVTFEIVDPLPADVGMVGPQIDAAAGLYLPGGASQLEMKVPASERNAHLKVVAVREIR